MDSRLFAVVVFGEGKIETVYAPFIGEQAAHDFVAQNLLEEPCEVVPARVPETTPRSLPKVS